MKELMEFLKKHLVLVICVAVAVMILGAGIWFLVSPDQPNVPDHSQTTESTGELSTELDTDTGFVNSGIVNIPGGDSSSGEVTPVTPEEENKTEPDKNEQSSTGTQNNNSNQNQGDQQTPSDNTNTDTNNQGSQQTPPDNETTEPDSTTNTDSTEPGNTDNGNQSNPQTGTVNVSGSVVENPFN